MPKEIKKIYNFMNLSYSSSIEEVQERKNVMINTFQAKTMKNHKSYDKEINKVVDSANKLVKYIEKNGVPNKKDNLFNTSNSNITTQLIVLISVIMVLAFAIYSLI